MRVLISIGCDIYKNPPLETLKGAENDASVVFEHLVTNSWGEYDKENSKLLLSPSISTLRSTVETVLFSGEPIEELTVFFAGHGGVKDGTYFLCLKDTDVDRMSLNALSMTQLFAWITEARIGHTNLVIDACQSGGVVHDVGVLLNPNVIGKAGSLAISILAASGSDEYAQESDGAGHCTTALMSCLKGNTIVQTTRPSFDLVEVGQVVSRTMQGNQQTPVCWGINLFGISQLAKNPCFSGGNAHISATFPGLAADSAGNEHIREASDAIWEQYLSLTREFDAGRFLDVIQPICIKLKSEPAVAATFVMGLSATFGARSATMNDSFEIARIQSACAVALLPLAGSNAICCDAILQLAEKVVGSLGQGLQELLAEFEKSTYALLFSSAGIADFYFLPLRVMSVLGWIGAAIHVEIFSGGSASTFNAKAAEVVRLIVSHYSNSIVPVSDELTPFYLSFASAAKALGCEEELETISCLLLRILHDRGARLAASGLNGDEALRFLTAVAEGRSDDCRNLLANPTSLLPAVLLVMNQIGLSDMSDGAMKGFDHTNINLFIPVDFTEFGANLIEEGTNFSLNIGHTIFSISDLLVEWAKIEHGLISDATLVPPAVKIACVLASLLRPDRVPWFLLSGQQAKSSASSPDAE